MHVQQSAVAVEVSAPFYGNPGVPPAPSGHACDKLWDYEGAVHLVLFTLFFAHFFGTVFELFLLGKDDRYLEVEISP